MTTLFVTATGTEVGKTYVAAGIAAALTAKGRTVRVLKPVISGFDWGEVENTDTALLLAATGQAPDREAIEACSPWRFTEPLSPDMAAKREGREVDFNSLVRFCRDAHEEHGDGGGDVLLIEGIGGVMVPLGETHTVLDWIEAVGEPALVVAGSYLGTLSHTLSAVKALEGRGIHIAGVVVAESEVSPVPIEETVETLHRFLDGIPLTAVARDAAPKEVLDAVAAMCGL